MLVRLQKGSLEVMDALKSGGVTVVEPEELVDLLENSWLKNKKCVEDARHMMTVRVPAIVPTLRALLEKLKQFKIPLALNNGDFATRNFGFKKAEMMGAGSTERGKETMVLFDWERAFISHPFLTFKNIAISLYLGNIFLSGTSMKVWSGQKSATTGASVSTAPQCLLRNAVHRERHAWWRSICEESLLRLYRKRTLFLAIC